MSYGTIKVNTITFTNNGVDQSVTVSGIVASTSGNLTVTGTVSGFTASFANGIFNTFSGGTCTITSGVLASGTASNPAISFNGDVNTGIYSPNANEIGFTTNGQARFIIDANGQLEASVAGSASSPTYTFANDVDTGLYSPGTNQLALSAGGVERARIDSSGRLLIGTSTAFLVRISTTAITPRQQLAGTTGSDSTFVLGCANTIDTTAAFHWFAKFASATVNDNTTAVNADELLGTITWSGSDGTNQTQAAHIRCQVDGTPGADAMPGRLVFSTTADGGSSPTERMRITSGGNVGIGTASPGAIFHTDQASGGSSVIGAAIRNNSTTASTGVILDLTPSTASPGVRSAQLEAVNNGSNQISFNLKLSNAADPITRFSLSPTGTATIFAAQGGIPFIANVGTSEVVRIDSAGRLLIGASTSYTTGVSNNWMLQASNSAGISNLRTGNDSSPSYLVLAKTRATSAGSFARVENNDIIGDISFVADDGTDYATIAAKISCEVDGAPGTNDMPGRLVFSTTVDGASSPTEALRITNDRVIAYNQAAPVSKSTAATLTIAELKGGIIEYTGNAQTLTLPTGTSSEGGFSGLYNNMTFEWSVINTGSGTCTVAGNTGHTVVGAGAVAAGSSGRFASRRTGANTFVTYRLS